MSLHLRAADIRPLYASGDAAHDFDHVQRVTRLAVSIAQAEGADVEVVGAAALLHDVPVPGGERQAHHLAAAEFAGQFLQEERMDPDRIANVVHCIQAHRFRDQTVQPQTLEAKCLYDGDKLDSIGAIGVARAFSHAGEYNCRLWHQPTQAVPPLAQKPQDPDYTPVHEFVYKLRRVLASLHTDTARQIGQQRHEFMCQFFAQLDAEMAGLA